MENNQKHGDKVVHLQEKQTYRAHTAWKACKACMHEKDNILSDLLSSSKMRWCGSCQRASGSALAFPCDRPRHLKHPMYSAQRESALSQLYRLIR
jgi:hypothetical protein